MGFGIGRSDDPTWEVMRAATVERIKENQFLDGLKARQNSGIACLKEGDIIQIDGPSVPEALRGKAFWRVECAAADGIQLTKPYRDAECTEDWFTGKRYL